jgi:hypothetical protein
MNLKKMITGACVVGTVSFAVVGTQSRRRTRSPTAVRGAERTLPRSRRPTATTRTRWSTAWGLARRWTRRSTARGLASRWTRRSTARGLASRWTRCSTAGGLASRRAGGMASRPWGPAALGRRMAWSPTALGWGTRTVGMGPTSTPGVALAGSAPAAVGNTAAAVQLLGLHRATGLGPGVQSMGLLVLRDLDSTPVPDLTSRRAGRRP